jgi:hypothetical protein
MFTSKTEGLKESLADRGNRNFEIRPFRRLRQLLRLMGESGLRFAQFPTLGCGCVAYVLR